MSAPRPLTALLEKQLRHRYRALDRALGVGVGPAESDWQLGGRPTIAWHARHVGEAIESTHEAVFGHPPRHIVHGLGTADGPVASPVEPWPTFWPELRQSVMLAASDLTARLQRASDGDLAEPPQVPILPAFRKALPTRQSFLEGHIYHVAYHIGSIAVLRAEIGLE